MALVPFPNKSKSAAEELEPDWDDHEPESDTGGKMSFLDHLDELRRRIIYSLVAVLVGFGIAFFWLDDIFWFIFKPMQAVLPDGQKMIYTEPGEQFFLMFKIGLMAGLMIAAPVVFSQIWLFIAPGLYAHEKKLAIPFVLMGTGMFIGGAAFSHYQVFPVIWAFFAKSSIDFVTFMPRVEPAFSWYLRLMLGVGITFQLPTVVLFLAKMGLITPRFMIRNFKYAVMIIALAAAVLSPDPGGFGMLMMGGPVVILYILSIGLAWAFGKKKKKIEDETA
ncbi:MAG TPA: twin-arginine translocase subunit TatC [Vicinamibacterales bacterium]|jgi:sec-independent protein translocase protein TatC|nr:twin-arginine translocase subunit TatC [Vicinamibacterales bacterium]